MQGTYPVIFLTFANIKAVRYSDMEYKITEVIAALFNRNRYLLEGNILSEQERKYYESIGVGMDGKAAAGAIHAMAEFMQRYYGKRLSFCWMSTIRQCRRRGCGDTGTRQSLCLAACSTPRLRQMMSWNAD